MKTRVLTCILCGRERQSWLCPDLVEMLIRMLQNRDFEMHIGWIKDCRPVEAARNLTVQLARDHNFDWLISLDNDNALLGNVTPLDIIAAAGKDKHVLGLVYGLAMTAKPFESDGFQMFPPNWDGRKDQPLFQEVPVINGGMMMINSAIWKAIPVGPWFWWNHGDGTETLDRGRGGCTEDAYFCQMVREKGFKVWTHRTALAAHFRTVDLTGMVATLDHLSGGRRDPLKCPQMWNAEDLPSAKGVPGRP